MTNDLVYRFIRDAYLACASCRTALGLEDSGPGLVSLRLAAGAGQDDRRGEVKTPGGEAYRFTVHESGYTFRERTSGKEIHFNVYSIDDVERISFSVSSLISYASSIGIPISPPEMRSELERLSGADHRLVHVTEDLISYYYFVPE
jgi:hypothetical protein